MNAKISMLFVFKQLYIYYIVYIAIHLRPYQRYMMELFGENR